jgi:cysteine-rich repeat protein
MDGSTRVSGGRVDIGADELTCGNTVVDPGEQCDDGNGVNGDGCDNNCTSTACGNGIVSAGEQCDDGNAIAGDCCAPTCQFELGGSSCDDGDICTNADACDGAGTCVGSATPLTGCRGTASGKSTLLLRDSANDAADLLSWKFTKGAATTLAEFSDPVSANGYTLCLYDASAAPQPRLTARAPAGSAWRASGTGFSYRNASKAPDGLSSEKLKAGAAAQTKIIVKGKGGRLGLPPLAGLGTPLTVQLRRDGGGCWGATFSSPSPATATLFKSKSE